MGKLKIIYILFLDVMRLFVVSCGIVLLIMFFGYEKLSLNRETITILVEVVFIIIIFITLGYRLLQGTRPQEYALKRHTMKAVQDDFPKKTIEEKAGERELCAVHEAGHAAMAYLLKAEDYTVTMTGPKPQCNYKINGFYFESVIKEILITYAGATAEEVLLNHLSCGSMGSNDADFERATQKIKAYIVMTDETVSKSMLNCELECKIIELSKDFYKKSKKLIEKNETFVRSLAEELRCKDFLSKEEIDKCYTGNLEEINKLKTELNNE